MLKRQQTPQYHISCLNNKSIIKTIKDVVKPTASLAITVFYYSLHLLNIEFYSLFPLTQSVICGSL